MTTYNSDTKDRLKNIENIFETFPIGYKNDVQNWGNFSKNQLHKTTPEGIQKLLHLDIDFGNSCGLRCPSCFRRDSRFDSVTTTNELKQEELINYLAEAKTLGLQSVKILGRGEPFENIYFLGFLKKLTEMKIGALVFTKGHVIGDDNLARRYNHNYGISTGKELVKQIKELDVSIALGFNSFDKQIQEMYVGTKTSQIKNYVELRDTALLRLIEARFNEYIPGKATRLALASAPIKPENIDEIFDIYVWGRTRNIYTMSCPSTLSGKGIDETDRIEQKKYMNDLKELYTKIYIWNIEHKLLTIDQLKVEGVSLYPGCHPCVQTAAGMYLTLSGKIIECPGRADNNYTITEDIRTEENLKAAWMKSNNYKRAAGIIKSPENDQNYHCVARDEHSITKDFYDDIKERVISYFKR